MKTAVEWLADQLKQQGFLYDLDIEAAKQMEKEQIMRTARLCHFEGVRQSAKTSEEYIKYGQEYYNQTYNQLKPNI